MERQRRQNNALVVFFRKLKRLRKRSLKRFRKRLLKRSRKPSHKRLLKRSCKRLRTRSRKRLAWTWTIHFAFKKRALNRFSQNAHVQGNKGGRRG